jgi:hypothetical protein
MHTLLSGNRYVHGFRKSDGAATCDTAHERKKM